jgi:hypothetical protein
MDVKGAKALKERLAESGADDAPTASVDADVPVDAPPLYHWLGVGRSAPETPPAGAGDEPSSPGPSLFRRLGLSFR